MFPEEIIQILQKYQTNNIGELKSINNNISEIVNQLKSIRGNLSKELSELVNNDSVNDKEQELLDDTKTLRNYINSISQIVLNNSQDIEISEEISTFKEFKDVKLHLCADNVCPKCGCNMNQTKTSYGQVSLQKHLVSNKKLDSYMCPACHRYFVTKDVINSIRVDKTNIKLLEDYYHEIPSLDINSAIVLSNTLKCSFNHDTNDIIARIPVLNENGDVYYVETTAAYCSVCNRFTILKDEFDKIGDIVTCKVIDETISYKTGDQTQNDEIENDGSILKYYGYNVQTQKNISEQQRHIILSSVIEAGIMSRRHVVDILQINIKRKSTRPDCASAIQKWNDDIEFVNTYKTEELPKVIFDKIILKYKQTK